MATVGNTYLDLADYYRRQDGDGQIAEIIDMLAEINPIMDDAIAVECNDGTSHLTTVRTGLPSGTWRKLYQGVQPSKSTTKQVSDTTGWLEAYSEVDAKLIKLAGKNGKALRLDESEAFIEGMSNQMATAMFYSDTASAPEEFMGLAPRFSSLSAENGGQIVDGGGTGADNTSIWFVVWSPKTVSLLYPSGSKAGIQREDLGRATKENSDGSMYEVFRDHFEWDVGLTVRDWRYVSRVANVDVSDIAVDGKSAGTDLDSLMIDAYYKLRQRRVRNGKAAIYCSTEVKTALHKLAKSNSNVNLTIETFEGREIVRFLGIPIRECDAILTTEQQVT
ncbi:MAG: phage capsid protein [Candidatus Zixiibacteriota bacterium]|nr:MAG: phage capsid protein [candidate division Zixibacteria bacterium]